ncbi:hypothetical protein Pelo_15382 [Pelomyxa schiedti]|nr:hypothetical protein Pelo_15382 [Pelomyxa schiedti]
MVTAAVMAMVGLASADEIDYGTAGYLREGRAIACSNFPVQPPAVTQGIVTLATLMGQVGGRVAQTIMYDYEVALFYVNQTRFMPSLLMIITSTLYRVDLGKSFTFPADLSSCTIANITELPSIAPAGNCTYAGTVTFNNVNCDKFHFAQGATDYMDYYFQAGTNVFVGSGGVTTMAGMSITLAGVSGGRVLGAVPKRNVTFAVPYICGNKTYPAPPNPPADFYGTQSSTAKESSHTTETSSSSTTTTKSCGQCKGGAYECSDTNSNDCHCSMDDGTPACINDEDSSFGSHSVPFGLGLAFCFVFLALL